MVFLGDLDRYPREEQLADCRKVAKELGLPAIGRSIYEHKEFDDLLHDLRGNELVMVPKLETLAVTRGRGVGKRFLMNLIKVTNQSQIIMDVRAGIHSGQLDDWYGHVETTRNYLVNGRKKSSEEMKLLRNIPRSKRGLVKHWTKHVSTEEYNRMAQHWRDPDFDSAQQAIDASPDEELRSASIRTWERIFKGRTGGRKKRAKK